MVSIGSGIVIEVEKVPLHKKVVYLKADCNFGEKADIAHFYYILDGKTWKLIGEPLKMVYSLSHFMGYRFGLFNFSTQNSGGYTDFDYFHISDKVSEIK